MRVSPRPEALHFANMRDPKSHTPSANNLSPMNRFRVYALLSHSLRSPSSSARGQKDFPLASALFMNRRGRIARFGKTDSHLAEGGNP